MLPTDITTLSSEANSIKVVGGDIYVGGIERNSTGTSIILWKNGERTVIKTIPDKTYAPQVMLDADEDYVYMAYKSTNYSQSYEVIEIWDNKLNSSTTVGSSQGYRIQMKDVKVKNGKGYFLYETCKERENPELRIDDGRVATVATKDNADYGYTSAKIAVKDNGDVYVAYGYEDDSWQYTFAWNNGVTNDIFHDPSVEEDSSIYGMTCLNDDIYTFVYHYAAGDGGLCYFKNGTFVKYLEGKGKEARDVCDDGKHIYLYSSNDQTVLKDFEEYETIPANSLRYESFCVAK